MPLSQSSTSTAAMVANLTFDSNRVKRIRVAMGKSQEDFAKYLHVSTRAVTYWEAGGRVPNRAQTIQALLDAEAVNSG